MVTIIRTPIPMITHPITPPIPIIIMAGHIFILVCRAHIAIRDTTIVMDMADGGTGIRMATAISEAASVHLVQGW